MSANPLDEVRHEIDALARVVHFRRGSIEDLPPSSEQGFLSMLQADEASTVSSRGLAVPQDVTVWLSDYALLLMWPVWMPEILEDAAASGRQLIYESLVSWERDYIFRDGYLVLVLFEAPDEDVQQAVREIEQDSAVCRKHVVWPERADADSVRLWKSSLRRVTVLGLPSSPEPGTLLAVPDLPPEKSAVNDLIGQFGSPKEAAEYLKKSLEVSRIVHED